MVIFIRPTPWLPPFVPDCNQYPMSSRFAARASECNRGVFPRVPDLLSSHPWTRRAPSSSGVLAPLPPLPRKAVLDLIQSTLYPTDGGGRELLGANLASRS